jgi:hypothetical protein
MKKTLTIFMLFVALSISAQSPIIDINDEDFGTISNAYYKDLDGIYNSLEGTWLYQSGSTLLKIKLRKRESVLVNGYIPYYEDFLFGEYEYIENGVVKVSTIPLLSNDYIVYNKYNLWSVAIMDNDNIPTCNSCPTNTKRVCLNFDEPANDDIGIRASMFVYKKIENNVEKLIVNFQQESSPIGIKKATYHKSSVFKKFSLPLGDYVLIKQP